MKNYIFIIVLFFSFWSNAQNSTDSLAKIQMIVGLYSHFHLHSIPNPHPNNGSFIYDPAFYNKQYLHLGFRWNVKKRIFLFFEEGLSYGPVAMSSGIGLAHDLDCFWTRTAFGIGYKIRTHNSYFLDISIYKQHFSSNFGDAIIRQIELENTKYYIYDFLSMLSFYANYIEINYHYKRVSFGTAVGKIERDKGSNLTFSGQTYFFSFKINYAFDIF